MPEADANDKGIGLVAEVYPQPEPGDQPSAESEMIRRRREALEQAGRAPKSGDE